MNCDLSINISDGGEALRLNWSVDGNATTSYWPTEGVPTLVQMLLGAAEKAATLQSGPAPRKPLERVFEATDMQLLAPGGGSDAVLRIVLGAAVLDFSISREQARGLQQAIAASPQAQQPASTN